MSCERTVERTHEVDIPVAIPEWVRWVAQDKNGEWWGYGARPKKVGVVWREPPEDLRSIHLGHGLPNPNWKDELYELEG